MKKIAILLFLFLVGTFLFTSVKPSVGQDSSPTAAPTLEANPAYKDSKLPVEKRVEDLLARMTLLEKIGQMTQVEKNSIKNDDITTMYIGSILSGGAGYPSPNTAENWGKMISDFQKQALATRLSIPIIYGVDAIHGHNNVYGTVIFPHNIGLGAANDPALVEQIGKITAQEMLATGATWNFGPVVAVAQDIRWGRIYESFSENTELVTKLSTAMIRGLQGDQLNSPDSVLATAKHFIGDGGTAWGSSTTDNYMIDQGVTQVDEATLRKLYLPPYESAVKNGAMSVMVSFSSWGGMKMHAQKHLITDVLKGELGFKGFVVSDWAGMDQITSDYYQAVVTSINAGLDMSMVPYDYIRFITSLEKAVTSGDIPMSRIDDAVRRILTAKFAMGLFERPYGNLDLLKSVGSEEHRAVAREAVSKSLVLLQNKNQTLPLDKNTPTIFVAGTAADDIGMQSGGWTIEWQGKTGDITEGTTILQAIQNTVKDSKSVTYDRFGRFKDANDANGQPLIADVGIMVLGESPYAEGKGDEKDLTFSKRDLDVITRLKERSKKVVIVLMAGRPRIITDQLPLSDAYVMAWLPGTEGQGVTDVLFGDKPFTGKLPFTWPRSMDQIPFDFANLPKEGCKAPLFPFGYGLDAKDTTTTAVETCS